MLKGQHMSNVHGLSVYYHIMRWAMGISVRLKTDETNQPFIGLFVYNNLSVEEYAIKNFHFITFWGS